MTPREKRREALAKCTPADLVSFIKLYGTEEEVAAATRQMHMMMLACMLPRHRAAFGKCLAPIAELEAEVHGLRELRGDGRRSEEREEAMSVYRGRDDYEYKFVQWRPGMDQVPPDITGWQPIHTNIVDGQIMVVTLRRRAMEPADE